MWLFPYQQEIFESALPVFALAFLLLKSSRYHYPSAVSWQLHWLHLYPESFGNMGNYRRKEVAQKYSKCFLSSFSIYTHYLFYLSKLLKKLCIHRLAQTSHMYWKAAVANSNINSYPFRGLGFFFRVDSCSSWKD